VVLAGALLRIRDSRQQHCNNNKYDQAARMAAPNKPGVGNAIPCRSCRRLRSFDLDFEKQSQKIAAFGSSYNYLGFAINY
jgi:hypothetical protein